MNKEFETGDNQKMLLNCKKLANEDCLERIGFRKANIHGVGYLSFTV